MRQKLITLCPNTWDLAAKKSNFSAWVRDQLRSERNKVASLVARYCKRCEMVRKTRHDYCTLCMTPFKSGEEE